MITKWLSLSYTQNTLPPPPRATTIIEPKISSIFFHDFPQKHEKFNFTILYEILSYLSKIPILDYNVRFYWNFRSKTNVVPLRFFEKMDELVSSFSSKGIQWWFFLFINFEGWLTFPRNFLYNLQKVNFPLHREW